MRGIIGVQKHIEFHLPHYKIPQLSPRYYITSLCIADMDMDMDMAIDRSTNSADRLSRDKAYLTRLGKQLTPRRDISHDRVQKSIKKTTCETIEYLKKREQFWQQLDFRKDEGATHVESYRFLM